METANAPRTTMQLLALAVINLTRGNKELATIQAERVYTQAEEEMRAAIAREQALESAASQPAKETPPSLPATEPQVDGQNGSNTSSESWLLVKEDRIGVWLTTATAMYPDSNSLVALGEVLKLLLDAGWNLQGRSMSGSLSLSGQTPSTIPVEAAVGPHAGGARWIKD